MPNSRPNIPYFFLPHIPVFLLQIFSLPSASWNFFHFLFNFFFLSFVHGKKRNLLPIHKTNFSHWIVYWLPCSRSFLHHNIMHKISTSVSLLIWSLTNCHRSLIWCFITCTVDRVTWKLLDSLPTLKFVIRIGNNKN